MGSFNVRCFLSRQNINPDDKCVIFPIVKQIPYRVGAYDIKTKDGRVFQKSPDFSHTGTTNWKPFYTPFFGVYADYGNFEFDNSPESIKIQRCFLDFIKKRAVDTICGDNSYHEKGFSLSIFDGLDLETIEEEKIHTLIESVNESIRCSGLFTKDGEEIKYAVCRRDVFDYVVEKSEKTVNWAGKKNLLKKEFFDKFDEYFDESSFIPNAGKTHPFDFNAFSLFNRLNSGTSSPSILSHVGYIKNDYITEIKKLIRIEYDKSKVKEFKEFLFSELRPYLECDRFFSVMCHEYGGECIPIEYCGQDYNNKTGRNLVEMVKFISSKIKKERDSE